MISFRKLLDPRSAEKVCVRTYELFLEGRTSTGVVAQLRSEGFTARLAARAVAFIASAFARVHYDREGLAFPDCFYPGAKAFQRGRLLRYSDEPVFQAALQLARQLRRDGDWSQAWRLVEISAEHKGIAEAQRQGLTPKSISFLVHEF